MYIYGIGIMRSKWIDCFGYDFASIISSICTKESSHLFLEAYVFFFFCLHNILKLYLLGNHPADYWTISIYISWQFTLHYRPARTIDVFNNLTPIESNVLRDCLLGRAPNDCRHTGNLISTQPTSTHQWPNIPWAQNRPNRCLSVVISMEIIRLIYPPKRLV